MESNQSGRQINREKESYPYNHNKGSACSYVSHKDKDKIKGVI